MTAIAILPVNHHHQQQALKLAEQLQLRVINVDEIDSVAFVLLVGDSGLSLQQTGGCTNPVSVDFEKGAARHRRLYGGGKGQMLAKAIGVPDKANLRVVDATAGLGRDAFVLASLGCELILLERSPIVSALLADGLARAMQDVETSSIISRMWLKTESAHQWLQQTHQPFDVVYLDPMFPEPIKTALVKKEMRIFHELIGSDDDADELLNLALAKANYRVVVKRPRLASALANREPTYSLTGKANRFDIYVIRSMKKQNG